MQGRIHLHSEQPTNQHGAPKIFSSLQQSRLKQRHITLSDSPFVALQERPDGIVTVAKFTSSTVDSARATEEEFDRLARQNPATLFIRCFQEYENANLVFGAAQVSVIPTCKFTIVCSHMQTSLRRNRHLVGCDRMTTFSCVSSHIYYCSNSYV